MDTATLAAWRWKLVGASTRARKNMLTRHGKVVNKNSAVEKRLYRVGERCHWNTITQTWMMFIMFSLVQTFSLTSVFFQLSRLFNAARQFFLVKARFWKPSALAFQQLRLVNKLLVCTGGGENWLTRTDERGRLGKLARFYNASGQFFPCEGLVLKS